MNKLNHITGLGVAFVCATSMITSCTDANDWTTDAAYDRLFGTKESSFKVTKGAVSAEVEWESTINTKYYIIEASTDSLYNDVTMGAENSIVYGEDGSITKSPYTITGLSGETTYYLRIKSMSDDKQSNWVYLPEFKFTTDKEQILNEVGDTEKTDEAVTLSWAAGLEVTHITYTHNGELMTYELSEEEKNAAKVTIMGLSAMTEYIFYIYNGDVLRGEMAVTTNAAVMVDSQVSDIQQTSAIFTWDTSVGRLTGYYFAEGESYPQASNQTLTEEQISAGKIELTGLEPNTTYTVAVMRDNTVRAMQTFKTAMGIPSDYTQVTVSDLTSWNSALSSNYGKVAIILGGNIDISNGTSKIPSSITSLLIYGGDDKNNKLYEFKTKGISFEGDIDVFEIYNVNLKSNGNTGNYILDFNGVTANINSLYITSCDISEARGILRIRNNSGVKVNRVTFNDCRFNQIGSYGLFSNEGTNNEFCNIEFINSTYVPSETSNYLIKDKGSKPVNLTIDYATLYGLGSTIISNEGSGAWNLNISNTVFGYASTKKAKLFGTVTSAAIEKCENVFLTSGYTFETSVGEETIQYSNTDLFENPTSYDFTIKVTDYKNFGDPYWNK